MKKKKNYELLNLSIRYFLLLVVGVFGLKIFYDLFFPLTIYPVFWLLNLFYDVQIYSNLILSNNGFLIEIIGACVAGSAYYLLFILNIATPKIKLLKRVKILLISWGLFLTFNVLRIFLLGIMYFESSGFLDITHKIFWYFGSTILIVLIWFFAVKVYNLKEIPFIHDLKYLYKNSVLNSS